MTTSLRRLPRPVRKLIAAIAVLIVAALALGLSWLTHRPTGYSGNARVSSFISPDFASGFDVAWEATASDLGITGQIAATHNDRRGAHRTRPPRAGRGTVSTHKQRDCHIDRRARRHRRKRKDPHCPVASRPDQDDRQALRVGGLHRRRRSDDPRLRRCRHCHVERAPSDGTTTQLFLNQS